MQTNNITPSGAARTTAERKRYIMNYYEFIMFDENGCKWNFEDCEENVVIKAHSEKEATYIFLSAVDSEYEEEAKKYHASKIDNMDVYAENHYYTIWAEWVESDGEHHV